jgi:elongation factor P
MINATDLKNGTTFLDNGKPYKVQKYTHVKIGRGGAIVRISARNLESGGIEEKTFSSNIKVEEVLTRKKKLQFLYNDGKLAVFMNPVTYEQVEVPQEIIKDELPFIREGSETTLLFLEERPLSIEIPPKITLTVSDTAPGVKGNTASNMYKSAVLENGISVKVPLFIKKGENVVIDTRTGDYVERAK